jgi:NADH:ubiquinone oxidoreductase subunit
MSIGTRLHTWLNGEFVGEDEFGNRYYQEKRQPPKGLRRRRWAMYNGAPDPTRVPAEWHAWLHYTVDQPLKRDTQVKPWLAEHKPNLTGSAGAYLPPGHDLRGGQRERTAADYEAWKP